MGSYVQLNSCMLVCRNHKMIVVYCVHSYNVLCKIELIELDGILIAWQCLEESLVRGEYNFSVLCMQIDMHFLKKLY